MGEGKISINTAEWTEMIKKIAYMEKALEHLIDVYHRALEDQLEGVSLRDIADVIEIAEAEKEVEVIA